MWSAYRTTKQMAAQVNDVFGGNSARSRPRAASRPSVPAQHHATNSNEQIGVQQNRTNFSREAKNPETPFRAVLKEDLLIGNWVLGSKRTEILRATEGQIWSKRQISDRLGRYKEPGERETEVNLCMSA